MTWTFVDGPVTTPLAFIVLFLSGFPLALYLHKRRNK